MYVLFGPFLCGFACRIVMARTQKGEQAKRTRNARSAQKQKKDGDTHLAQKKKKDEDARLAQKQKKDEDAQKKNEGSLAANRTPRVIPRFAVIQFKTGECSPLEVGSQQLNDIILISSICVKFNELFVYHEQINETGDKWTISRADAVVGKEVQVQERDNDQYVYGTVKAIDLTEVKANRLVTDLSPSEANTSDVDDHLRV